MGQNSLPPVWGGSKSCQFLPAGITKAAKIIPVEFDFFVVGLGNPGEKYALNRHNAGFCFVDSIAQSSGSLEPFKDRNLSYFADCFSALWPNSNKLLLVKPTTYMNNSGQALSQVIRRFNPQLDRVWIVYDDLDLSLGVVRIRKKGSAGTHRGVVSVVSALTDENFPRIRLGIGPKPLNVPAEQFVLEPFRKEEVARVDEMLQKAKNVFDVAITQGIDYAISKYSE